MRIFKAFVLCPHSFYSAAALILFEKAQKLYPRRNKHNRTEPIQTQHRIRNWIAHNSFVLWLPCLVTQKMPQNFLWKENIYFIWWGYFPSVFSRFLNFILYTLCLILHQLPKSHVICCNRLAGGLAWNEDEYHFQ